MLGYFFAACVLTFLWTAMLFTWLNDRKDQRYSDELDRLRDERQRMTERHDRQVAELLQRIQAPEMAVIEHAQQNAGPDPNPYPKNEYETAADQGVTQAMIAQIERMERESTDMHMPVN